MNARILFGACVVAMGLSGCGGGDDGGTAPPPPPPAAQATYASPQAYTQNEAIASLAPVVTGTVTSFSVTPALPAGLSLNPATGAISGTPSAFARDTDHTVSVTGPGGTTTTHLHVMVIPAVNVSRLVAAGTSIHPTVSVNAAALGITGTLHAQLDDAGGLFGVPVTVSGTGGNQVLQLSTLDNAAVRRHAGKATLKLCADAACTARQPMPSVVINYDVNVLAANGTWPGNHLTPLSAIPGAPEWSTFQGNAAHTGHVPVAFDVDKASTRWQIPLPAFVYYNGRFNLATVVTEGGRLFVAGDTAVTARSEHDGSTLWSHSFSGLADPSVNPPAVRGGTVYVAAGQQASTTMFGLDASNGAERFRSAMSSQWENYLAPTVGASGVYTNAGTYGGLYAFDLQGAGLYVAPTAFQTTWTPAVDAQGVYAYTGDALRVFHPTTGALQKTIINATYDNYIYEINGAAVLGRPNSVFAGTFANSLLNDGGIGNWLLHFNLLTDAVDWSIRGVYPSTPAYDAEVLYAVNNNPLRLEARAEGNGSLLWSWSPPASDGSKFVSEVLLTQNTVIVSTSKATYVIDRTTHLPIWSYPGAGNLALSANGILYISSYAYGATSATLTAINLR